MVNESNPRRAAQLVRYAFQQEFIATTLDMARKRMCVDGKPFDEPCTCEPGIDKNRRGDSPKTGCPEIRTIIIAYRAIAERARVRAQELSK